MKEHFAPISCIIGIFLVIFIAERDQYSISWNRELEVPKKVEVPKKLKKAVTKEKDIKPPKRFPPIPLVIPRGDPIDILELADDIEAGDVASGSR